MQYCGAGFCWIQIFSPDLATDIFVGTWSDPDFFGRTWSGSALRDVEVTELQNSLKQYLLLNNFFKQNIYV